MLVNWELSLIFLLFCCDPTVISTWKTLEKSVVSHYHRLPPFYHWKKLLCFSSCKNWQELWIQRICFGECGGENHSSCFWIVIWLSEHVGKLGTLTFWLSLWLYLQPEIRWHIFVFRYDEKKNEYVDNVQVELCAYICCGERHRPFWGKQRLLEADN